MQISNQELTATIKAQGAELTSLIKNATGVEYLWQGDPQHWGRHAPVLFPIVGKLKDNTYHFEGKSYQLGQHGFARDEEFILVDQAADSVTYELTSSPKLFEVYPFGFRLQLKYELIGSVIQTHYTVFNEGESEMYFSIGGHPAFNCPVAQDGKRDDYALVFAEDSELVVHQIDGGLFSGETEVQTLESHKLKITDELFDNDALVLKSLKSDEVILVEGAKKWLTFHFPEFPYLGIWSKSRNSPFLCIEPWFGLADNVSHDQDFTRKEGIRSLPSGEHFHCVYGVAIH